MNSPTTTLTTLPNLILYQAYRMALRKGISDDFVLLLRQEIELRKMPLPLNF